MAKANIHLLGGDLRKSPGSSHYDQATFGNGRTWPLDFNADPIPARFLGELRDILQCSLETVRGVLS
jgi:hypothetical protein